MAPKDFNIGNIIRALGPTPTTLEAASRLVHRHKDDPGTYPTVKIYLRGLRIAIHELLETTLVFWQDDPIAEEILSAIAEKISSASLEELPEFLSSEDHNVRLLAAWRLDSLMNK